jgi:hypothetical protein
MTYPPNDPLAVSLIAVAGWTMGRALSSVPHPSSASPDELDSCSSVRSLRLGGSRAELAPGHPPERGRAAARPGRATNGHSRGRPVTGGRLRKRPGVSWYTRSRREPGDPTRRLCREHLHHFAHQARLPTAGQCAGEQRRLPK